MTISTRQNFWPGVAKLFSRMPHQLRRQIWSLLALTLIGALSEALTIGAVVPYLALLAGASRSVTFAHIELLFAAVGADTHSKQLVASILGLCLAAMLSGALRLLLVRRTQDFAAQFGHDLSVEVQRRRFFQPYSWQVRHNSSEQIAAIEKVEFITIGVVLPIIQAASALILIIGVVAILLAVAPVPTIVSGVALGIAYYLLASLARSKLHRYSDEIGPSFAKRVRIVQEGAAGIRDIILDRSQAKLIENFRSVDLKLVQARANAAFVSAVPRFLIEPLGIIIIAVLALFISGRSGGLLAALPVLGAVAIGAQRMLPLVQQLYHAWSNIAANRSLIDDVLRDLRLSVPAIQPVVRPLAFEREVEFREVSFSYPDRPDFAVHRLSFMIPHGSRVAVSGSTGAGKSTTADLVMGLLEPTEGSILIDDVLLNGHNRQNWQTNIAHVPQMLFISDATLAQNIALSAELDMDRVRQAAATAQLEDFVGTLPNGYETSMGERGVQISGGQRQRLAIARAIYKNAPVLVFDEATSALDEATEKAVLRALDQLHGAERTIIIIAHRQTTIEGCDIHLQLENGILVKEVSARHLQ